MFVYISHVPSGHVFICTGVITGETNDAELAAFIAYATAFPDGFLCLVDTYDVIK